MVKGQGHEGQKTRCALQSPPAATEWNVLAANIMQRQAAPFRRCRGDFGGGKYTNKLKLELKMFYQTNRT